MDTTVETLGAIGLVAIPGIVVGVAQVVKTAAGSLLPARTMGLMLLVLGVGATFLANAGGVIEYENVAALVLVGLNVGLAARGLYHSRQDVQT